MEPTQLENTINFSNNRIIDALKNSVKDYNESTIYKLNFNYDELDGTISFSKEDLEKLKAFELTIDNSPIESEDIKAEKNQSVLNELNKVLENTNFNYFTLKTLHIDKKNPELIDLSFLEKLNPNLKFLTLKNIDLSNLSSEKFAEFKDLQWINLKYNNITNPEILNELSNECFIDSENPINEEKYSDEIVKLISKRKGRVSGLKTFAALSSVFSTKSIHLKDYIRSKEYFDFSTFEDFKIEIENRTYLDDENIISEIKKLNSLKNVTLEIDAISYSKLHKHIPELPANVSMHDVSELSSESINKFTNIKELKIRNDLSNIDKGYKTYTRDEYLVIRERIDEIIKDIPKTKGLFGISETEIFAKVYKKLAMEITYDYDALTEEGLKDQVLQKNCRNLYNGLVEGKCVCLGYADILRNVLSCFGIPSTIIAGRLKDPKDNSGHAWNRVNLNGTDYNVDLTLDRDALLTGKTPRFFLKSDRDFKHDQFKIVSGYMPECIYTMNENSTRKLLYGPEQNTKKEEEQKDNSNQSYLGKAIKKAASFLRIDNFLKAIKTPNINKDIDKSEKDENQDLEER